MRAVRLKLEMVAKDINLFIARCLSSLREDGQSLDETLLLKMCAPRFNWRTLQTDPSRNPRNQYADLIALFSNIENALYPNFKPLRHYDVPELQHQARRLLLKQLLQAGLSLHLFFYRQAR